MDGEPAIDAQLPEAIVANLIRSAVFVGYIGCFLAISSLFEKNSKKYGDHE